MSSNVCSILFVMGAEALAERRAASCDLGGLAAAVGGRRYGKRVAA